MKRQLFPLLAVIFLAPGIVSCQKEMVTPSQNTTGQPAIRNTAPVAFAGPDMVIQLPYNIMLDGSFYDAERNVATTKWRQVSGPDSCVIRDKDSLKTVLNNLRVGVYEFELTVTDKMNLYGKDTVKVTAAKQDIDTSAQVIVGDHEVIFKNLTWIFPWYSSLELKNIHNYFPAGTAIKVFIKRDTATEWNEVVHYSNSVNTTVYDYFIETRPYGAGMYNFGSLYVFYYALNPKDTPDVKVQF